jgi:outer membrane protein assembly factor BamE (lipoprotein component of BamABCDE complex)
MAIASIALLAACATDVTRGHPAEAEFLASVKPGVTTQAETLRLLGSPSSQSSFGPPTWYYISSVRQTRAVFAPRILDQHVTEIDFDANKKVSEIKQYTFADSKPVAMNGHVTPSEGQSLGFFEQIVSNLGRFNKQSGSGGGINNSHTHGNPSGVPTGQPTQ